MAHAVWFLDERQRIRWTHQEQNCSKQNGRKKKKTNWRKDQHTRAKAKTEKTNKTDEKNKK